MGGMRGLLAKCPPHHPANFLLDSLSHPRYTRMMPKLHIQTKPQKLPKSKRKARIVIAKDVIKALHVRAILAEPGTYFAIQGKDGKDLMGEAHGKGDKQIHALLKKTKDCQVCALGAMFTCHVARFDKVTVDDYENMAFSTSLEEYFPTKDLALIETAFEQNPSPAYATFHEVRDKHSTSDLVLIGRAWGRAWPQAADRMMAIMVNIVENDGTFDPATIPTELPKPPKGKR